MPGNNKQLKVALKKKKKEFSARTGFFDVLMCTARYQNLCLRIKL